MFSFLRPKSEGQIIAVFAVESGSVALTISRLKEAEAGSVVYVDRRALDIKDGDTPADCLRKTTNKIEEILNSLFARKYFHIIAKSKTLILLGSPWSISFAETIEIKKEKPFKLTEAFVKTSIEDKFGSTHADLDIVSSHLMEIRMNGYKIKEPFGKSTSAAEFETFIETAPKEALSAIHAAITKHLPHSGVKFSTINYAGVEAVARHTGEKSFILILPEANATEISIVKEGVIKGGASLPFGSLTLAKKIFSNVPSTLRASEKEAISKIKRLIEGGLDDSEKVRTTPIIEDAKNNFLAAFHEALFAMSDTVLCPSIVYIGGKSPAAFFISDWIKKEDYGSRALTENCFKVSALSGIDIMNSTAYSGNSLPFVSAVSAHAARSFVKAELNSHMGEQGAFEIEINKLK